MKRPINKTLLLKVKKQILAKPAKFIMTDYIVNRKSYDYEGDSQFNDFGLAYKIPKCGSMACIAGWTCLLGLPKKKFSAIAEVENCPDYNDFSSYHTEATKLLGLTDEEARDLFLVSGWPTDLVIRWKLAKTRETRAAIAAERIDRIIEAHCGASK